MINVQYDFEKLGDLLRAIYEVSGQRFSLADANHQIRFESSELTPFCARMNSTEEGHRRCVNCDTEGAMRAELLGPHSEYRCHAGIFDMVKPIMVNGQAIGCLYFGQFLGEENIDQQWADAEAKLQWCDNIGELKELFYQLPRLDAAKRKACATLLEVCCSYILLEGIVLSYEQTDAQKLNAYIEENYAKALTMNEIAQDLCMSRAKLSRIAAKEEVTVMQLLARRRMSAAKQFLRTTDLPVSEIAEMVGMRDYNYFSKFFRSQEGITPSAYRRKEQEKQGS